MKLLKLLFTFRSKIFRFIGSIISRFIPAWLKPLIPILKHLGVIGLLTSKYIRMFLAGYGLLVILNAVNFSNIFSLTYTLFLLSYIYDSTESLFSNIKDKLYNWFSSTKPSRKEINLPDPVQKIDTSLTRSISNRIEKQMDEQVLLRKQYAPKNEPFFWIFLYLRKEQYLHSTIVVCGQQRMVGIIHGRNYSWYLL